MNNRKPIIVAHRGLAGYAPENTLPAYAAALELGFGLEIDARLTSDNRIILLHDATVDRTTDGDGAVGEQNLMAVQGLDAGSWFDSSFRGLRVPTLEEALKLVGERCRIPTLILLDFKAIAPAIKVEATQLVGRHGLLDQVVGFGALAHSPELRQQFKTAESEFLTACTANTDDEWNAALVDDSLDWIYFRFMPTEAQIADAHHAGKRLIAGGPIVMQRQSENWLRLRQFNIDAMITDYPLECQRCWRDQRS